MSRQDQAARTRETIIDAAAQIFDLHGYPNASLSMIVETAGVAKGALYFHFASKEDLARVIINQQFLVAPPIENYADGLQGLIDLTFGVARAIASDVRVRAAIRLVIEHASFTSPLSEPYLAWTTIVRAYLEHARTAGDLRPGILVDDAAMMIVGCFTGIQLTSEVLSNRKDIEERLATFWDAILPWLAAPRRRGQLRVRG